jgi:hypothetical protein
MIVAPVGRHAGVVGREHALPDRPSAQQIQYELKLEEAAKSGFIYGLGVQKLCWETRYGTRPSIQSRC